MPLNSKRALKVFLCHASGDKPYVRELYKRLLREGIDAWLDQDKLLPGQDWRVEIPRAVRAADVVVICLSNKSITKEGYIQKEIKFALDVADEKPDGTIFLIPARIEDCPVPEKLSRWQWVDLFEENGYTRLLRSLKLDAETIGADKPASYEDSDDELEQKLEQLYTEGLAAYYTEDWNKACQRFQAILSERPNHLNALKKLEEAELQRDLSKLYKQAVDANQAKDWQSAIKAWEELLKKSPEYRDAAQLFKKVKQQKQLSDLYTEAKKLHTARKWQAVVKVFDQILLIDPSHPDPDNLLPAARQEVADIKRLADLNDMYSQAVREIDMKHWQEANKLLEQVDKSQMGFLETELLLRKVQEELRKVEENIQRTNQINTLYEQAHGLVRAKSWRKALDKVEEIRKLNSNFEDKDGIVEKIHVALALEEQQAQRQNQLAALYADAVRLLKEEKYADALAKWEEVKAIDPKYPDRQSVQKLAQRKLKEFDKAKPKSFLFLKIRKALPILGAVLLGLGLCLWLLFWVWINLPIDSMLALQENLATATKEPTKIPTPMYAYSWQFGSFNEDWGSDIKNDISSPYSANAYLTFRITGTNPYLLSPANLNISANKTPIITIRMHIEQGNMASFYFLPENGEMSEETRVDFSLYESPETFTYNIDMSKNPLWQGTITRIRLDPVQDDEIIAQTVEIDFITIHAP